MSKQEREQLQDVILVLRANKLPTQTLAQARGGDQEPGALATWKAGALSPALSPLHRRNPFPGLPQAVTAVATGADVRPGIRMLAHLSSVTTALESSSTFHSLPYDEVQRQYVFHTLADVLQSYAER